MSGSSTLSPARRLRTKTSDLTELLRSSTNQNTLRPRKSSAELPVPPPIESSLPTSPGSTKGKRSRLLPFLRSRKKSLLNETPSLSSNRAHSSEVSSMVTSKTLANGYTVLMINPQQTTTGQNSSVPTTVEPSSSHSSALPPVNVSPQSLGTKFAAHFSAKPKSRISETSSLSNADTTSHSLGQAIRAPNDACSENTLRSRSVTRPSSSSSGTSSMIRNRSPTPKQPTITVSVPPRDSLDDFRDLFYKPTPVQPDNGLIHVMPIRRRRSSPELSSSSAGFEISSSPSPTGSPTMRFPNPPPLVARSMMGGNAGYSMAPDGRASTSSLTSSSKRSSRNYCAEEAVRELEDALGTKLDLDELVDSGIEDVDGDVGAGGTYDSGLSTQMGASVRTSESMYRKRRAVPSAPAKSPERSSPSITKPSPLQQKSATTTRSTSFSSESSRPPAMPLPTLPGELESLPTIPSIASSNSSFGSAAVSSSKLPTRARAHTISTSSPNPGRSSRSPPVPAAPKNGTTNLPSLAASPDTTMYLKNRDSYQHQHTPPLPQDRPMRPQTAPSTPRVGRALSKALDELAELTGLHQKQPLSSPSQTDTPAKLYAALALQRSRFDELAAYLLTITERHIQEKSALERRIESLEREARKRDREVKGLRYLVMHSGLGPGGSGEGKAVDWEFYTTGTASQIHLQEPPGLGPNEVGKEAGPRLKTVSSRGPDTLSSRRLRDSSSINSLALPSPTTISRSRGLGLDLSATDTGTESEGVGNVSGGDRTGKRTSAISASSVLSDGTYSSSVSSLSLPSLSASASGSSSGLSAIPELVTRSSSQRLKWRPPPPSSPPPSSPLPSPSSISALQPGSPAFPQGGLDPTVLVAIQAAERFREKEERKKSSRSAKRVSTTSSSASTNSSTSGSASLTATNAYASNLKRGRPPSIAQVLEATESGSTTTTTQQQQHQQKKQIKDMEEALKKLRPFGA